MLIYDVCQMSFTECHVSEYQIPLFKDNCDGWFLTCILCFCACYFFLTHFMSNVKYGHFIKTFLSREKIVVVPTPS